MTIHVTCPSGFKQVEVDPEEIRPLLDKPKELFDYLWGESIEIPNAHYYFYLELPEGQVTCPLTPL